MKRVTLLTGKPGIGKTTILKESAVILTRKNYKVGGMVSAEIRENNQRVGFEILNFLTGARGTLAHTYGRGLRFGKYRVNLDDLVNVGVRAIDMAVEKADVIIIDEVGPMELFSSEFERAVQRAADSGKPVIGTIHYRAQEAPKRYNFLISRPDIEIIEVTLENRFNLSQIIAGKILASHRNSKRTYTS